MSRAQSSREGRGDRRGKGGRERVGPCANRVWRSQKGAGSRRAEPEPARPTVVRAGHCRSGGESPQVTAGRAPVARGAAGAQGGGAKAERGGMMALAHSGLVRGKVARTGPPALGRDSPGRVSGGGRREVDGER